MRDRIIEAYLADFVTEYGFQGRSESEVFEHFVNYCVVSKHHPDSFDPDDVSVGGTGDLGLDGLAILVNDHIVSSNEDVDYLKKALRRLDVQFIFVQAKASQRFESSEIGTVISGVRQFFNSSLPRDANDGIRSLHRIKEHIFDSSIDMDHTPVCRIYYATTGVWNDEAPLRSRIDQGVSDLNKTNLFSAVEFIPLDAEGLKGLYRQIHHKIVREIVFEKHTILPQIAGVEEAYIGVIPCTEYLKVICNEDGTLNRRLFYDNVRDFQGHNPVNMEIASTIQDTARNDRFSLLNNGITIVAADLNKVGTRFKLKDFQIVNGCQTSHILYLNRDQLTPNIYLPVKLIVTADSEVTSQVIQGTNRQTEVKIEAFESLAPFQKKLEELYLALAPARKEPIYYERRSKQYDNLGIRRERIVTLPAQIKCFLAMFLNEPQSTHRYYGELLASYRGRLFSDSHSPLPYYVSGLSLATLERIFVDGAFPYSWKPRKFQLLMVYRLQNEVRELPPINSRAIESYCDALIEKLDDQTRCIQSLRKAGELVEEVRTKITEWREPPERTRAFTVALIEAATHKGSQAATTSKEVGFVKWFSDIRGYGFIQRDSGDEIFVHYSSILGEGYRSLTQGQKVMFAIVATSRGNQAIDVEAIS